MLSVRDTGVGSNARTRAHIFEPFFTTKERGKGTGLGLSTVYGIVSQSGGHICIESEPGGGSIFKVYLPRVCQPVRRLDPPRPLPAPRGGSETVLLVEDEDSVRRLVFDALTACGYHVLPASNARRALEIFHSHTQPIHILVSDLVMPGKGGADLARELLRLRGDIKVLFLSGYTDNQIFENEPSASFLQKPFTMLTLTTKIRELLDLTPS